MSEINNQILEHVQVIWEYMKMNHQLQKADIIVAFGCGTLAVADRAADVFFQNLAPTIVCTGGFGRITKQIWNETEADKFAQVLLAAGVPEENILIENQATNTGDNLKFTQSLLQNKGLKVHRVIGVTKTYMERRLFGTFPVYWPGIEYQVTSPLLSFQDCYQEPADAILAINAMVGDLQRIQEYPARGYMISQEIPAEIWRSWEWLVQAGFDQQLLN
ncbi:MAG: YdcF family protein [Patescibacteria group bacterium]